MHWHRFAQPRGLPVQRDQHGDRGKSVTVPNRDVLVFDGDLVSDWQIYIDLAPVFA